MQTLGQDRQVDSFNKLNQVLTNLIHLKDVSAFYHNDPLIGVHPRISQFSPVRANFQAFPFLLVYNFVPLYRKSTIWVGVDVCRVPTMANFPRDGWNILYMTSGQTNVVISFQISLHCSIFKVGLPLNYQRLLTVYIVSRVLFVSPFSETLPQTKSHKL